MFKKFRLKNLNIILKKGSGKMKELIKYIIVLLFIIIGSTMTVNALTYNNDKITESLKNYLGSDYEEEVISNNLSAEKIKDIEALFKREFVFDNIYPNYIGGMYINNNNKVVIQIVKQSPEKELTNETIYNKIQYIVEDATIEYVKYSYNEVYSIINILNKYYEENYANSNIVAYYDDVVNNRVVVELKDNSSEEINNFKKNVVDSPVIFFKESSNPTDLVEIETVNGSANYLPGGSILTLPCSIGFRAKLGTKKGFVTAAHCIDDGVGQEIPLYGVVKKWKKSGKIDAAWIESDPLYPIGDGLKYNPQAGGLSYPINNTPVKNIVVGELYGKSGFASEYTYGKIKSLNYSASGITDLVFTDIYAQGGDSGGIVFKILGTGTKPTSYITAGIVKGGISSSGGNMYFTKASNIVSDFGLTTY